jgi:hypothetical protein
MEMCAALQVRTAHPAYAVAICVACKRRRRTHPSGTCVVCGLLPRRSYGNALSSAQRKARVSDTRVYLYIAFLLVEGSQCTHATSYHAAGASSLQPTPRVQRWRLHCLRLRHHLHCLPLPHTHFLWPVASYVTDATRAPLYVTRLLSTPSIAPCLDQDRTCAHERRAQQQALSQSSAPT